MRNLEDWLIDNLGKLVIGLVLIAFIAVYYLEQDRQRLISQCIEDGRKEYECKAMFRSNSNSTVYNPVFIPR